MNLSEPVRRIDGSKWVQPCYVCKTSVNFERQKWHDDYVQVEKMVRHTKCYPGIPKLRRELR